MHFPCQFLTGSQKIILSKINYLGAYRIEVNRGICTTCIQLTKNPHWVVSKIRQVSRITKGKTMDGKRLFLLCVLMSASLVFAAPAQQATKPTKAGAPATVQKTPAEDPSEALTPDLKTPVMKPSDKRVDKSASPLPVPTAASTTSEKSMPAPAEVAVILSQNQFFPRKVHVSAIGQIRLWFTTVDPRPAALVLEGLKVQRWLAAELGMIPTAVGTEYYEVQRELTKERVTEVILQPPPGKYTFFDAVSGAEGELIVE